MKKKKKIITMKMEQAVNGNRILIINCLLLSNWLELMLMVFTNDDEVVRPLP